MTEYKKLTDEELIEETKKTAYPELQQIFHKNDGIIPEILPGLPLTDPDFYPLLPESLRSTAASRLCTSKPDVLWMFLPSAPVPGTVSVSHLQDWTDGCFFPDRS